MKNLDHLVDQLAVDNLEKIVAIVLPFIRSTGQNIAASAVRKEFRFRFLENWISNFTSFSNLDKDKEDDS